MTTQPEALVGTLTKVVASWHRPRGAPRGPEPLCVWLALSDAQPVQLHTASDGRVALRDVPVYEGYDMGEYGHVDVETDSPPSLAAKLGQPVIGVSRIRQDPPMAEVGFVLHFDDGSVAVANLGDELVIREWPDVAWSQWGVSEVAPA